MAEGPIANRSVLVVSSFTEDRCSLLKILGQSRWQARLARTFVATQRALRASPFGVVICEARLCDGYGWADVLYLTQEMLCPPPLVVADRLADESLWAEVLNLGGFDLLAKPFDAKEVIHVVSTACRRSGNELRKSPVRQPAAMRFGGGGPGSA